MTAPDQGIYYLLSAGTPVYYSFELVNINQETKFKN
jgi:hypothetical protein